MKMRTISRTLSLLLAALVFLTLCSCGSDDAQDTVTGFGDLPEESTAADESLWMQDIEMLKGYGYSSNLTRSGLYQFEEVIHAEKNAISAIVTATNTAEEKVIVIYYLKDEAKAGNCIRQLSEPFKQVGIRIVHGDQDNLIHN